MFEVRAKPEMVERALLVGMYFDNNEENEARALLLELEELVKTLGIEVVGMELVKVRERHRGFLCGTGKTDELIALARENPDFPKPDVRLQLSLAGSSDRFIKASKIFRFTRYRRPA